VMVLSPNPLQGLSRSKQAEAVVPHANDATIWSISLYKYHSWSFSEILIFMIPHCVGIWNKDVTELENS
jgi:hypothetical protein